MHLVYVLAHASVASHVIVTEESYTVIWIPYTHFRCCSSKH